MTDAAFSVKAARAAGIGEGRLRGSDLARPFHGVRTPTERAQSFLDRCYAYMQWLRPGNHFSHETAARILGLPLPPHLSHAQLHVTSTRRAPSGAGITGHQTSHRYSPLLISGLPTSPATQVFLELAPLLSVDDLVAVGDALILEPRYPDPLGRRPWTTLSALRVLVAGYRGRGAANARAALELVRQGSESRPETHLRLLAVRAGFGDPELNVDVYTASGIFLGRGDLVFRRYRVLLEFDGDQHRTDRTQYEKDATRIEGFTDDGWKAVRVRSAGLFITPARTVARIERALRAQGWTP